MPSHNFHRFFSSNAAFQRNFPENARVCVIGSGVIGSAIAHQLTLRHFNPVVIDQGGGNTSAHAASFVSQRRKTKMQIEMAAKSIKWYKTFEKLGASVGWRQTGSLSVVRDDYEMTNLRRQCKQLRDGGVECEILEPEACKELYPLLQKQIAGGLYLPKDGLVDAHRVCQTYRALSSRSGATFVDDCEVSGFETENRRITKIITTRGEINVDFVVLAAGMWTRELSKKLGLNVPIGPVAHQYVVLQNIPPVKTVLPVLRYLSQRIYVRPDAADRHFMVGYFPENPKTFTDLTGSLLPDDEDQVEASLTALSELMPGVMKQAQKRTVINGRDCFSVDGVPLIGTPCEGEGFEPVTNLIVSTGYSSLGFTYAGGQAAVVADALDRRFFNQIEDAEVLIPPEMNIKRVPSEIAARDNYCIDMAMRTCGGAYNLPESRTSFSP